MLAALRPRQGSKPGAGQGERAEWSGAALPMGSIPQPQSQPFPIGFQARSGSAPLERRADTVFSRK